MGHSTSAKVVQKKGKRSILKMANNLVGQLKETGLNTNHIKEALGKAKWKKQASLELQLKLLSCRNPKHTANQGHAFEWLHGLSLS